MAYTEDYVGDKTYRTKLVVDVDQNVVDENGKPAIRGIMGLRTDITDLKKIGKLEVENMRLAAEEQAAKASNELKSKFLANVSTPAEAPVTLDSISIFLRGNFAHVPKSLGGSGNTPLHSSSLLWEKSLDVSSRWLSRVVDTGNFP